MIHKNMWILKKAILHFPVLKLSVSDKIFYIELISLYTITEFLFMMYSSFDCGQLISQLINK